MENAYITEALVWGARYVTCYGARVTKSIFQAIVPDINGKAVEATPVTIADFIARSVKGIPGGIRKEEAMRLMQSGLVVDPVKDNSDALDQMWRYCERTSDQVSQADFEAKRVAILRDVACESNENRDAISNGIIRNWIRRDSLKFSTQLIARRLLGENGKPCDIGEAMKRRLRALLPAPPPTTSPSKSRK